MNNNKTEPIGISIHHDFINSHTPWNVENINSNQVPRPSSSHNKTKFTMIIFFSSSLSLIDPDSVDRVWSVFV